MAFNSLSRDHGSPPRSWPETPSWLSMTYFQLPLSGSQEIRAAKESSGEEDVLSTPSLGITQRTAVGSCPATDFQLPLSGSLNRSRLHLLRKERETFNSLSRDHRHILHPDFSRLPLHLSTPSLGITIILPGLWSALQAALSTPSLGITCEAKAF